MVLIYTKQIKNRLKYACTVLFKCVLNGEFELCNNIELYKEYAGAKINYSKNNDLPGIQILPHGLLSKIKIEDVKPKSGTWNELAVIFYNSENNSLPFDIFSACFYMTTRYEEYLPFVADSNGRFEANQSIADKNNFLHLPIIDLWAEELKKILCKNFPTFKTNKKVFKYISTIDIDSAYAYKHKGVIRSTGGFVKDILQGDFQNFRNRLNCIWGGKHDPYDTYEEIKRIHTENDTHLIFFFLLADYGLNDKNLPHSSRQYKSLIRYVDDYFEVGIHPGFMSNTQPEKLPIEIKRLSETTRRDISKSRQHFLILKFPETYRRLLDIGITEDYSMGYATKPGFRAGTSNPFPFYDLENNSITKLMIHPFTVMDATLNSYMNLSPEEGLKVCKEYIDRVKAVDGTFISLWHNESLSNKWKWSGWKDMFSAMISYASEK